MIFSPSTRSLQTSLPFLLTFLRLSNAQARDNEADEARITDPTLECTPYNWPPLAPLVALYPANWLTATIVQGDTVATNLFNSLNSTIPNIPSKGTITNSVTGVTYNTTTDPDCWWTETQCTTPKRPGIPKDVVSCPEPGVWGLTYDDGPNCSHNAFYDYLLSANQKATLFYIGSNMENHPLEAQRGLADGHEICVHTWSHPYMTSLSNEQAFAELYYTKKFIKDLLGITVKCWRPPFGDVDDRIRYIANALGMATVIWVADTFDYEWTTIGLPAVDTNYQNIINSAPTYTTNGPIILSHELDNGTMSEAEKWLPTIQKTFKAVMPVAVCHNNSQPYLENSYVYPNFAEWVSGSRMYSATSTFAGMNATNAPVSGFANIVSGQSVSTDPGYATPTITGGIPTSTTSTTQLTSVSGSKSSSSASSTGSGKPSGGSTTSGGTRVSMFGIWMAVTVGVLAGLCLL